MLRVFCCLNNLKYLMLLRYACRNAVLFIHLSGKISDVSKEHFRTGLVLIN